MTLRWLVASVHLLALAIGLGAIDARARTFKGPLDDAGLSRLFLADNLWGLAAALWLATGVPRAFMGLEKGTAYYLSHPFFHAKLALFVLVFLLELWPMVTLVRWRARRRRGEPIDTAMARTFARISHAQAGIVVVMVFLAAAIARGVFHGGG